MSLGEDGRMETTPPASGPRTRSPDPHSGPKPPEEGDLRTGRGSASTATKAMTRAGHERIHAQGSRFGALRACLLSGYLAGGLLAGCAGSQFRDRPYVEAKDTLFVALPVVPPVVDSLLAPLGWDSGKFAGELRKELRFQLNRKGVATPDDSAGTGARLEIAVDHYAAAGFSGLARLTTAAGDRDIRFSKQSKGSPEHQDPTIDDIRLMAGTLAEAARMDPRHRKRLPEPFTGLILIF